MAIASSSSASSEQVLQHAPLHHQIAGPDRIVSSKSTSNQSWDCCYDCFESQAEACDACPNCADRCGNVNCQTCANKSPKTAPPSTMFLGRADDEKYYTSCQLRRHDHAASAWLLVGDTIYDSTEYMAKHPGGMTSILKKSGGKVDCSVDFEFHSKGARKTWRKYKVGKLCPCPSQQSHFGTGEQCTIS